MPMIKEYSYLYKIITSLINNKEYIADEINTAGSRKAAKTYSIDELIALLGSSSLAYPNKKVAIWFRCKCWLWKWWISFYWYIK